MENKFLNNYLQQTDLNTKEIEKIKQSLGEALPDPIPGPQGEVGPQGVQGEQGPRGKSLFTSGWPLRDPGSYEEGDLLLCITANDKLGNVYKKIRGSWVLQCNIRGPQGIQGQGGGTEVIANPEDDAQDSLSKIEIDGVIYDLDIPQASVSSVNGKTGVVVLNAGDINATNAQSIQQNLERIDERIDDVDEELDNLDIPTKTSDLTNDSGFITSADIGNTFVEKTNNANRIYGTNYSGVTGADYSVDTDSSFGSIPMRNLDNDIMVPETPSSNGAAASKKYVDTKVGQISVPTKTSDLTNDSGFITSSYHDSTKVGVTPYPDMLYGTNSNADEWTYPVSDFAQADEVVTKVSSTKVVYATNDSGNQTTLVYSTTNTANSLAQRTATGALAVGQATALTHATNKQYVDNLVKNSTITLVDGDGGTIGSFTLNQSSNKTITIPSGGGGSANELMHSHTVYLQKHNDNGFVIFRFNYSSEDALYNDVHDFLDDNAVINIATNSGYTISESQLNKIRPVIWIGSTSGVSKTGYTSEGDLVVIDATWDLLAEDVVQIQNKGE